MSTVWGAALIAVFAWWMSTGVILFAVHWADRASAKARGRFAIFTFPFNLLGLWLLSSADVTVAGAYQGFVGALLVWGWVELSFLTGAIVGQPVPATEGQSAWRRFGTALRALIYHEAALVAALVVVAMLSVGLENRVGMASFLILYLARVMAKLNLYFGVPRINIEFLPRALAHLKTYFRQGPITFAFPVAITLLTIIFAVCAERLWTAETDPIAVGFALLSTLTALALLEHWLMVVPLPDAKLWRWLLPDAAVIPEDKGKTHGF